MAVPALRSCLSCGYAQPLTEYAYHGAALVCDNCRWSGAAQDPEVKRQAKVIHERNRRKRLRAMLRAA